MSINLRARLARLETGGENSGVQEISILNDLPDDDEPPGPRADVAGETVYMAEGEALGAFRARCRAMAGKGGMVLYSRLEAHPDYPPE
jgi:hypothetical protein